MTVRIVLMDDTIHRLDQPDAHTALKFETDDVGALIVLAENEHHIWVVRAYAPGVWKTAEKL